MATRTLVLISMICLSRISQRQHLALATSIAANMVCSNMPGLVEKQQVLCRTRPDVMVSIGAGADLAAAECQWQFRKHRWNCSLSVTATSLQLGDSLPLGSKEAGFAISLKSAAIAHSITQGCSSGRLRGCGCDESKVEGEVSTAGWRWGGCSADIDYGVALAQIFTDASNQNRKSARDLMNLHNRRAGRKLLKRLLELECKCHGPSGSCAIRTCWMTLPSVRKLGDMAMKRYHKAKKVLPVELKHKRKQSLKLYRTKRNSKSSVPKRGDIVFIDESPNYCEYDQRLGSLGTVGRQCNKTSTDSDSCTRLCCGRGYNTYEYIKTWQCNCTFHWCCSVTCNKCQENVDVYTCK